MAVPVYTIEQLTALITNIDAQIASGVSRAGYDGKNVEMRSVNELIQIRNDYNSQLNDLLGVTHRRRKYLTTTRSDKGL